MARLPLLLTLALALLLPACNRESAVDAGNKEKILLVGNGAEPKSLDPQKVTGVIESNVITSLFEGLATDHPSEDNTMVPGVATSWESNQDYTQWTFHLRPEARWSDGVSLTSEDFIYSYKRMLHPLTAAPYAAMLYDFIEGAQAYNTGETTDFADVGVKAPDPHTLVITCKEPVPFLPSITRHYTWFPVPKHVIQEHGGIDEPFNNWSEDANIVSNGAFKLKEWLPRNRIAVRTNEHYWDRENVHLNGVDFYPIENPYTESRSFLAGQLHLTYTLPSDQIPIIAEDYPQYLHQDPYVGTVFLRINTTSGPLKDVRVRKALALAVNRQSYVDNITVGYKIATALTPKMGTYTAGDILNTDPEKARQLLADAGYPNGEGFPEIELLITGSKGQDGAEAVQEMWSQELNIRVKLKTLDWGSYISEQHSLSFDIAAAGWIGDYLDPTTFLNMWTKGNGNNNTGWSSPEFESLLTQAALAPTPQARQQLLIQAETLFLEDAPIIPIAWYSSNYMLDPSVKNWHPLLLSNHPWKDIRLESADSSETAASTN